MIEDAGQSLSPLIDIGQIEGGFVMGLGWWLTEELVYDPTDGALLTDNTWTYKPMLPADIPEDFRVTMLRNAPNPHGVLSSKGTAQNLHIRSSKERLTAYKYFSYSNWRTSFEYERCCYHSFATSY